MPDHLIQSFDRIEPKPSVKSLAIGVFDGVHLGHRRLLNSGIKSVGSSSFGVLTFWPHPLSLIKPELAPPLLCRLQQRCTLLRKFGTSEVEVIQFEEKLRQLSATEFLNHLRLRFPSLKELIVGENFRFGHNREGSGPALEAFEVRTGVNVIRISSLRHGNDLVSSSRIRAELSSGNFVGANELLGYEWSLSGQVIEGRQVGRTIGFPTANLEVSGLVLPPIGVYSCMAESPVFSGLAAVNVGRRPTFETGSHVSVEAHLLGFNGNLYGQEIVLRSWSLIRNEMKFRSLDELKHQIAEDIRTIVAKPN
jgi:riboflavin kinase/FMN adenylyltransferase